MAQTTLDGNVHVTGTLSCQTLQPSAGSVVNNSVAANAALDATKLVHQFPAEYWQPEGAAVAAETVPLHVARGAGTLVSLEAMLTGAVATGADRTVTIDLQKGNASTGFASVLTGTIAFGNTDALRTVKAAVVLTAAYADNDVFRLVVTVAGAAGAQAQGLIVTVTFRENP
jgi:hypothetical protein